MAPKDPKRASAPSGNEDAFAATVAPAAAPTTSAAHDATVAAPSSGPPQTAAAAQPPLPLVDNALYRVERELARGGMGRIVAAEDRRLGRAVALKELLEPDSGQATRFEREALITARLQHPGIVPVYEAGRWPSGEPFFAMKLVSGRPLDKVIAEATSLEARLALLPRLAAACDAIAYAHSHRIIHRDLKPGNVLIGDFGETVVIDWGLAKDLDADDSPDSRNGAVRPASKQLDPQQTASTLTVAGAVMGTPAYMPPEQARGDLVDQRADVFALGAMLYHVLAGVPPYNARTASEVIAAAALGKVVPLRDREPRAPRDLAAIIDRAMQADPTRRYPHAGELADELRRFLTGQLVDAHRYTALQRVARFVRRHRAAVTIATVAVLTLSIGGTIAVTRIVRARDEAEHETKIATTRKVAAERLIDYMFSNVSKQLAGIGRLDLMSGLGNEVKHYFDALSRIPGGMPREDQLRMAEAIELVGDAEHKSGKADVALDTLTKERDKLERLVGSDTGPHTKRMRQMIAKLDFDVGSIDQERGKAADAIRSFDAAKRHWDELRAADPDAREVLLGAAETHDRLGDLLRADGKIDQAFDEYSEAKAERERAASQGNGKVSDEMIALSTSHLKLAAVYQNRGESGTALGEFQTALRLRESLLGAQPDNVELQKLVLDVQGYLADLQRKMGDDRAVVATYRKALPVTEALVRRDPANTEWQRLRGTTLSDLGLALLDSGAFKAGLGQLALAITVEKELAARDPKSTSYRLELARTLARHGDGLVDAGQTDDAIAEYDLALGMRQELVTKEPASVSFRRAVAWSHDRLGHAYVIKGELARALDATEAALALRMQLVAEAQAQGDFKNELALSEVELGRLLIGRDSKRADELIARGTARARVLADGDPDNNEWKDALVRGLLADALAGKATGDRARCDKALGEAVAIAVTAAKRATENAHWPGLLGEIDVERAELATARHDAKAAEAAWQAARDTLEPVAKTGRLPAPRLPLLERVRARR